MPQRRSHDAAGVAAWMLQEFKRNGGLLNQAAAVQKIREHFGDGFIRPSRRGSIHRTVLAKFKELTGDTVVWDFNQGGWRRRTSDDPVGTRHAYE